MRLISNLDFSVKEVWLMIIEPILFHYLDIILLRQCHDYWHIFYLKGDVKYVFVEVVLSIIHFRLHPQIHSLQSHSITIDQLINHADTEQLHTKLDIILGNLFHNLRIYLFNRLNALLSPELELFKLLNGLLLLCCSQ